MEFTRRPIRASRHHFFSTERTQVNAFDGLVTELTHLEKLLESIQVNLNSYPSSLDMGWLEILTPAEWVGELVGLNKPKGRGRLRGWFGRGRMDMEAQASTAKVESTISLILAMSQLTMHNMASETKSPANNASSGIQEVYIEPIAQNPGRTKEECPQVLALEEHRRVIRSFIDS